MSFTGVKASSILDKLLRMVLIQGSPPAGYLNKHDTGTTNGLRHGTQFGVSVREDIVTVWPDPVPGLLTVYQM